MANIPQRWKYNWYRIDSGKSGFNWTSNQTRVEFLELLNIWNTHSLGIRPQWVYWEATDG